MSTRNQHIQQQQYPQKIRSRRDSISPMRKSKANEYRERSRDRSHDRSSIVSNGQTHRTEDSSKDNTTIEQKNDEPSGLQNEERGRSTERKINNNNNNDDDDDHDDHVQSSQDDMMMKLMGFGSFDSTKGKHVNGVGSGTVKKNKKAQFRQYMNREKGFNRNLSPDRKRKK